MCIEQPNGVRRIYFLKKPMNTCKQNVKLAPKKHDKVFFKPILQHVPPESETLLGFILVSKVHTQENYSSLWKTDP